MSPCGVPLYENPLPLGRIEQIDDLDGQHLLIRAVVNGKSIAFSTEAIKDASGRVRLGHDLAVTAYSSQGLTAETAIVVLGAEYDRHTSYVAVSRARGETQIVYDKSLLAAGAKAEQELREQSAITEEAEILYLAKRLSRANLKTSTLAFGADVGLEERERRHSRGRTGL